MKGFDGIMASACQKSSAAANVIRKTTRQATATRQKLHWKPHRQ
jgi:hypothetical protein